MPLEHIHPGDRLRVRPGEKVPVDGVVTEGVDLATAGVGVDERPRAGTVLLVELADEELLGAVRAVARWS